VSIEYNGNLDEFYESAGELDDGRSVDVSTRIFRFVRMNHAIKSVADMANEIMQYGWSDSYENAVKAVRSNLLFDDSKHDKPTEPPSLFDGVEFK